MKIKKKNLIRWLSNFKKGTIIKIIDELAISRLDDIPDNKILSHLEIKGKPEIRNKYIDKWVVYYRFVFTDMNANHYKNSNYITLYNSKKGIIKDIISRNKSNNYKIINKENEKNISSC